MKTLVNFLLESEEDSNINAFCILKPGFLSHKEDFLNAIEDKDWHIENYKELTLSKKQSEELYSPHKDKDFYDDLVNYMTSGKIIALTAYKKCKDPIRQMDNIKKKFRDEFGKDEMKNGMHSSDSLANVKRESKIIF